MADTITDFATRVGQLIKGRSPIGHKHPTTDVTGLDTAIDAATWGRAGVPTGAAIDQLGPGVHQVNSWATANSLTHPAGKLPVLSAGAIEVLPVFAQKVIRWTSTGSAGRQVWQTELDAGTWTPWHRLDVDFTGPLVANDIKGDGTDETAKVQALLDRAASLRRSASLPPGKTIGISAITIPSHTVLATQGSVFRKLVNNSTPAVKTAFNVRIDHLSVELVGGSSADMGVQIGDHNTQIDRLTVRAMSADQPGPNALLVGNPGLSGSVIEGIRLSNIALTGFRTPMRVVNVRNSLFTGCRITNFLTGVYVIDTADSVFADFYLSGTSASATGGPGENGFLLESQRADDGVRGLAFVDCRVRESAEHGYRIGGSLSVCDITFDRCVSALAGNAPNYVATGASGFKALGVGTHLHRNLRYINCTVEDASAFPATIDNASAFSFGHCKGVYLANPINGARTKSRSGRRALLLEGCSDVLVRDAMLLGSQQGAILIRPTSTTDPAPRDQERITITGTVEAPSGHPALIVAPTAQTLRDVSVDLTVVGEGTGADIAAPTASSPYERVSVALRHRAAGSSWAGAGLSAVRIREEDAAEVPPVAGPGSTALLRDGSQYVCVAGEWKVPVYA